jgi:CelD/BcsL family acetyltransferase involved in cellulose biosynthesis
VARRLGGAAGGSVRFAVTAVRLVQVGDIADLGARWRDLERRAAGSFFQSWTWVGCLAAERFPDPILVEATDGGRVVALALFNRIRRSVGPPVLYLGESGRAELDCPYIEQNGVLAEAGREEELAELCLLAVAVSHDLVLSGVGDPLLAVARRAAGLVSVRRVQASPFVDLAELRRLGADYLAGRTANTRQQIRRSDRFYEQAGPIVVETAESVMSAHAMLDEMAALHQAAWTARGQPGSFARPFFRRFHRALVTTALPRREVSFLKISCGKSIIGILYNFTCKNTVSAYQSGFLYPDRQHQAKPGLTCHHRAIRRSLDQGFDIYDFLAGEDRYKRSLSDLSHRQSWVDAGPLWSVRLLLRKGLRMVR